MIAKGRIFSYLVIYHWQVGRNNQSKRIATRRITRAILGVKLLIYNEGISVNYIHIPKHIQCLCPVYHGK